MCVAVCGGGTGTATGSETERLAALDVIVSMLSESSETCVTSLIPYIEHTHSLDSATTRGENAVAEAPSHAGNAHENH